MSLQPNLASAGLRRSTQNTRCAQQLSRDYDHQYCRQLQAADITRTKAIQVAKRAAAALGLKSTKIALIDQLFGFSKECDWLGNGAAPIIWPSNALLARRMGIAVSTVRYHLRGLADAGLIAYNDHPTYQRSGRRDINGKIIEAYGINLSPIAMRFEELTAIVERAEYVATVWRRLSHQRTVLRKEIMSMLLDLDSCGRVVQDENVSSLFAQLDRLRETKPRSVEHFKSIVEAFEKLRDESEALAEDMGCQEISTTVSSFEQHTTTALSTTPVLSNQMRHRATARSDILHSGCAEEALERKHDVNLDTMQCPNLPHDQQLSKEREMPSFYSDPREDLINVSLPLVKAACRNVLGMMPEAFSSWNTFRNAGPSLCRIASINPQVFEEAQGRLGNELAITALAITVERSAQGSVLNAGAYLRSLTKRGHMGTLHLSRSLFALVEKNEAHRLQ